MNDSEHYRELASHALAGFQLIEASLKHYIGDYHDKVRVNLPAEMTYEYSGEDVKDVALGKLVSIFAKVNANKSLIADLRSLQRTRNDLAHRALVKLYGPGSATEDFASQGPALVALAERLGQLLGEVIGEHIKLVGKPV